MNYRKFDHLDDEQASIHRDLCRVVERHFGITGDEAADHAKGLMSLGAISRFSSEVFEGPKDVSALKRLDAALSEAGRAWRDAGMTMAASNALIQHLHFGPYLANYYKNPEEALAYAGEHGSGHAEAFIRITEVGPFREAIAETIRQIEDDPRTKRSLSVVNVDAIKLVESCRYMWAVITKRLAPEKDLNPASKFAKFLTDVMEVYKVGGSPRSAFLAWAREYAKRP